MFSRKLKMMPSTLKFRQAGRTVIEQLQVQRDDQNGYEHDYYFDDGYYGWERGIDVDRLMVPEVTVQSPLGSIRDLFV